MLLPLMLAAPKASRITRKGEVPVMGAEGTPVPYATRITVLLQTAGAASAPAVSR